MISRVLLIAKISEKLVFYLPMGLSYFDGGGAIALSPPLAPPLIIGNNIVISGFIYTVHR